MTAASPHIAEYLDECRRISLEMIRGFVPADRRLRTVLYDPMLDYPFRPAKGIRPALCLATCGALGGRWRDAKRSAAVLELYHNAFLIHDDVEDGSQRRREAPTLHRIHGRSSAINIGDAMLALALQPLLDNLEDVGVGPALRILQVIARMSRETAEGQAIELDWIHRDVWDLRDRDYVRMVHKKTGWYSFIAPVQIGCIIAGARSPIGRASRFAALLGIAFQVRDDLLNLVGPADRVGKEPRDDLLEGKRTVMLLHLMRSASERERDVLRALLRERSPRGERTEDGRLARSDLDVAVRLMERHGSLDHAQALATRYATRARRELSRLDLAESIHRDVLFSLVDYVIQRDC